MGGNNNVYLFAWLRASESGERPTSFVKQQTNLSMSDWPASCGDAIPMCTSPQPLDRFTCGLLLHGNFTPVTKYWTIPDACG